MRAFGMGWGGLDPFGEAGMLVHEEESMFGLPGLFSSPYYVMRFNVLVIGLCMGTFKTSSAFK